MTNNNHHDNGSAFPVNGNRLPIDHPAFLAQMVKELTDECCPAMPMFGADVAGIENETAPIPAGMGRLAGSPGRVTIPAEKGMELPDGFNTGHFLDPAFLSGIANNLYSEGRPPISESPRMLTSPADKVALARGTTENLPLPGAAPMQAARFDPVDFSDTRIFLSAPEDGASLAPASQPEAPGLPFSATSEPFYFLTPVAPTTLVTKPAAVSSRSFHIDAIRQDFPILHQTVHGKPLIWMDNAATTQKPRPVIAALTRFYEHDNSNIHRAAHTLAARATDLYESARDKVRRFLGASQPEEIIFVHGATEAINLVAQTYGRQFIGPGDEIVVSTIEHHANIVPWQHLVQEKGAVLRVIPVNDRGEILLEDYEKLLGPRTRFVAITQVSNALGTILPVRTMTQLAHRHGAKVLIDGAQSTPHMAVDVQALDCDFFVVAGHKLFGPTGIGVLYGKRALLELMPPWQGGGNMIDQVTFEHTTYQPAPAKFEAGTGILAGAVSLGAAIDYLDELGMENISRYEHELLTYATAGLNSVPGLHLIGTAAEKASVLSFVLDGIRTEDVGRYLDQEGIAVRAGHHCAQPTMKRFGVASTVRPSLAFYNTPAEIDVLVAALHRAKSSVT